MTDTDRFAAIKAQVWADASAILNDHADVWQEDGSDPCRVRICREMANAFRTYAEGVGVPSIDSLRRKRREAEAEVERLRALLAPIAHKATCLIYCTDPGPEPCNCGAGDDLCDGCDRVLPVEATADGRAQMCASCRGIIDAFDERDRLAAQVERVRALAFQFHREGATYRGDRVLRALDAPAEDQP